MDLIQRLFIQRSWKPLGCLVLGIICCLAPPVSAQTVVEEIVARVNDSIITSHDLQRSREQLQQELKQQNTPGADAKFAAAEKDVLRDLIDQKLLVGKAKDEGVSVENELIKRLDEMRKSMNLESMEELEKAAQAQGVSFEDYKDNMRNNMLTQQVIGQEVGHRLSILPSEVKRYYDDHQQEMVQPEAVDLAEILISTDAPANSDPKVASTPEAEAARLAAAETKAKGLLDTIRKGAKFEDVAKQSSDGPTAAQGGDLGGFKRGALAREIEDKVFAMKAGEVTDVMRTKQGFIILKVVEHVSAGVPPLKDVEPQIQEALYYQRLKPALREFLTKLREEAFVDIKPGFVDTGASPRQTKPIITAQASPSETKEKKRKKKLGIF